MTQQLTARSVAFHGDELIAVQQPDRTIFVQFGRLCENLGLNRSSQLRRIQRHEVLRTGLTVFVIETPGGVQPVQFLRVDLIPLWLSGLHASRVKDNIRDKLVRYQSEAAVVLWQAFKDEIVVSDTIAAAPIDDVARQQLEQLAELGRAITRMAEQQLDLQNRQQHVEIRLDSAARYMRAIETDLSRVSTGLEGVDVRLAVLEDRLVPGAAISEAQATEVSQRVKALAELLTQHDSAKNHYQAIFNELYRRFGVSSYKLIPQSRYASVLQFLEDWRASHRPS